MENMVFLKPQFGSFQLAVDENGKFIDLDFTALSNSGHTIDLSMGVMRKLLF